MNLMSTCRYVTISSIDRMLLNRFAQRLNILGITAMMYLLCFGDVDIDIQFAFGFRPLQCTRFLQIYTQTLGLNLAYGTSEPLSSPQKPTSKRPECDNTHCHRRVIQRLRVNWVCRRKAEDDGDESDPPEETGVSYDLQS